MRITIAALSLPLLSLAACGGAGVQTVASVAPPTGTAAPTSFLDVSATTSFDALGSFQSLSKDKTGQLYNGNATTPGTPSGTISYSPRDGIFTLTISDSLAAVSHTIRYQDPAHRSATPRIELEVPQLAGFNYLAALDGTVDSTFFYSRPGSTTTWVSLGAFSHTTVTKAVAPETVDTTLQEHGVFVFGNRTPAAQVPATGTGKYQGQFLATMVAGFNALQWISGTSTVDVDFAKATLALGLSGTVLPTYLKDTQILDTTLSVPTGSTFAASGSANYNGLTGAFAGRFTSATLTSGGVTSAIDFTTVNGANSTAGASSIDGGFYGANAAEIGGNLRITGGVPNTRIDILGAFTGKK